MIHQSAAAGARTALQKLQLADKIRLVEHGDVALREEGLDLQIGCAFLKVPRGRGIVRHADLRLLVAQTLGAEALAHPARRVAVPDHGGDVIVLTAGGNFNSPSSRYPLPELVLVVLALVVVVAYNVGRC